MSNKKPKNKNLSLALNMGAVAVGMLLMAYASVPLYNLFCRVTGYGGATQISIETPKQTIDRTITIRFNTDVAPDLNWQFTPEQKQVDVKIGEQKLVFFSAQNKSPNVLRGTALYNVTPSKAGSYFNKVQCFCFDEQTLQPGESAIFPVSFFIDPEIVNDKNADDIKTITLSYTFFKAKES